MSELDDSELDDSKNPDGCTRVVVYVFLAILFVFTVWFLAKLDPDNSGNFWEMLGI